MASTIKVIPRGIPDNTDVILGGYSWPASLRLGYIFTLECFKLMEGSLFGVACASVIVSHE
jgi:hypothetical protein